MIAIVFPMIADDTSNKSSEEPITLILHPIGTEPNPTIHRAPMHICIEAYYDALSKIISIYYAGEVTGKVALYRDGKMVDARIG